MSSHHGLTAASPSVIIGVLLLIVFTVSTAVYRLFLSPLAKIPGPTLAALSLWYQVYYDVYLGGQLTFHIQELHKQYGPIVRIGPSEVHISDPDFYENIYTSSQPFSKYKPHQSWTGVPNSVITAIPHSLHKIRRAALNPFFSKQVITRHVTEIQGRLDILCYRLNTEYKNTSVPVRMDWVGGAISSDVIMQYFFAKSYDSIKAKDFKSVFVQSARDMTQAVHVFIHFPWIQKAVNAIPERIMTTLIPSVAVGFDFRNDLLIQAKAAMDSASDEKIDGTNPTVFEELLRSNLPPQEKTLNRLHEEAQVLVGAGLETVKNTFTIVICHILMSPIILQNLRAELQKAWPDVHIAPSLPDLEKLPYLTAIVQEGLRLAYGLPGRLVRSSDTPVQYKDYVIPPGTGFSMSCYAMHHNESIFPNSHAFDPTRWLPSADGAPAVAPDGKRLSRYMVSFSKGARICLGIHLAYAELYIGLANLFRKVDMELYETTMDDVTMKRELFVPWFKDGTQGVRVLVK